MLHPRLDILPPAQLKLWPRLADLPRHFVLYGGTAIALRLGHRTSIDFDFFSSEPLGESNKRYLVDWLGDTRVLLNDTNTLVVSHDVDVAPVKLSFFGGLKTGRVGVPDRTVDTGLPIASSLDLLAHKLKTINDRGEGKDYQDIEALLDAGLDLGAGLAAQVALFGDLVPPMVTVKALTFFDDLTEPERLTDNRKSALLRAAKALPNELPEIGVLTRDLADGPAVGS